MKLKQIIAGGTIAGALGAAALGMGTGLANAAPGAPPPAQTGGHGAPPADNHGGPAPGNFHPPAGPNDPGGPGVAAADPAVRADPREDPVTPVAEAPADPVTQADTRSIIRGDPVAQAGPRPVTRTDPVGQADPAHGAATRTDPVAQAGHGAAIPSAVTSTGLRGGTARDPGDGALRRGQRGTGRFRRPVGGGHMAQSTTGVTTKRPCGIPDLTSGASGSSGSGSRCNR